MPRERFYPEEENLGKNCAFWQGVEVSPKPIGQLAVGCFFPKFEMEGRTSCEGMIDDVCLFLKNGRRPHSLTEEQITEIKTRIPDGINIDIPPGDIKP